MSSVFPRVAALAAIAALLLVSTAAQAGGGTTQTRCGVTLCLATTSTVSSVCGKLPSGSGLQCTGVIVSAATPAQAVSTGGSVTWRGWGECQVRERGDGFNNDWSPWRACPTGAAKEGSASRSWSVGNAPIGGTITLTWGQEINVNTAFVEDCIEVRAWVWTLASASSSALGVQLETVNGDVLYPSYGYWYYTALCESDSSQREWIAGW